MQFHFREDKEAAVSKCWWEMPCANSVPKLTEAVGNISNSEGTGKVKDIIPESAHRVDLQVKMGEIFLKVTCILSHHTCPLLKQNFQPQPCSSELCMPESLCAVWMLSCSGLVKMLLKETISSLREKKNKNKEEFVKPIWICSPNLRKVWGASWKSFRCWWQELICDVPESSDHKKSYRRFRNPQQFCLMLY